MHGWRFVWFWLSPMRVWGEKGGRGMKPRDAIEREGGVMMLLSLRFWLLNVAGWYDYAMGLI